jgi:adenosine deaminase
MLEVGRALGMDLPGTSQLRDLVQISPTEPFTFVNFLSKFQTLRLFYRSPEIIERITREAIADAAADNVRYLELRFTPVALGRAESFPLRDVIDWVIQASQAASGELGIKTRLIANVNRHESPELATQVARLAAERISDGLVGLDLAGNEADFSALLFTDVIKEACQAGLQITLHAGEWGGAQNVREAIDLFAADRIGHGVHVIDDQYTTALAREHGTPFEVCLTSNYQTGAVQSLPQHPAPQMIAAKLNVTLNTDDPSISQITLGNEYRVAVEDLKIPKEVLKERILAGAQAAFLPDGDKKKLIDSLKKDLSK